MGTGASAGLVAVSRGASAEHFKAVCAAMSSETREKVVSALADVDKVDVMPEQRTQLVSRGFLELHALAGLWQETSEHTEVFRLEPTEYDEESVAVKLWKVVDGVPLSGENYIGFTFDLASCSLRDAAGNPLMKLSFSGARIQLIPVDAASVLLPVLTHRRPLERQLLTKPLWEDSAVQTTLCGCDFLQEELRDLTEEEFAKAADAAHLSGPGEAPTRSDPRVLFVIAPSGGGKTTCVKIFGKSSFDMQLSEVVHVDSAVFRDFFDPYHALIENGITNGGIWFRAWPSHQPGAKRAKEKLKVKAVEAKKDLVVSNTGSSLKKLMKEIDGYKSDGYVVNLLGIFADPEEVKSRGIAREVQEGKRYTRDIEKHMQAFEAFVPAVNAINGSYCLVRNSTGHVPTIYKEGKGGEAITFDLANAIA